MAGDEVTQAVILPYNPAVDQVSVIDLWLILVRHRLMLGGVALAVISIAVVYVLLAPREYQVTVHFLPPTESDIDPLHLGNLQKLETADVYAVFKKNLKSRSLLHRLFTELELARSLVDRDDLSPDEIFESFAQNRILISRAASDPDKTQFKLVWRDPGEAVKIANEYTALVERATASELVRHLRQLIKSRIQELERLIASKRELEEQRRLDMIARLEEAATIAEKLGLEQPLNLSTQAVNVSMQSHGTKSLSGEKTALLDSGRMPLYFLGSEALHAEADTLRQRKSNDPFVANLRNLEEELAGLRSLKVDDSAVRSAMVDQPAFAPTAPIKPNMGIILSLGAIAAVLAGVFSAFFLEFLSKAKTALQRKSIEGSA